MEPILVDQLAELGERWGTFARPHDHEDDEWELPDPRDGAGAWRIHLDKDGDSE